MEHTKGEWKIGDESHYTYVGDGGGQICLLNYPRKEFGEMPTDENRAEREANAKLIASAPDLLEALERMVKFADGVKAANDEKQGYISAFESSMILQAKQAIKKATE